MSVNAEHTSRRAAVALAGASLLALSGCTAKPGGPKGKLVSVNLPLSSYVKMDLNGRTDKSARFFFPQLQIYDESGYLIYSSHESVENARILKELPVGIQRLQPKKDAARLAEIMEDVPAFRERKEEILGQRRISVMSIFLQDCRACTIQEDALSDAERRLLDRGINLLVIHLARPGA